MATVGELATRMREEFLDDVIKEDESDNKWRTSAIVSAISATQDELCRRFIKDIKDASSSLCRIRIAPITSGSLALTFSQATKKISRITGSFITDGFVIGLLPTVNSTLNAGPFNIASVTALEIEVEEDLLDETITAIVSAYPQSYPLDNRIIKINEISYPGSRQPLIQKDLSWFNQHDANWLGRIGTPTHFTTDYETDRITFNRVPDATGIAKMQVSRLPLKRLSATAAGLQESPELVNIDDTLIHGALKWLYMLDDDHVKEESTATHWSSVFESDIRLLQLGKANLNPQKWVTRGNP